MKKNTLLYLAIAGVGGYFLYKKYGGSGTDSEESETTSKGTETDESDSETGKKVKLNAGYEEDGIDKKLNKAKEILDNVQDISEVIIKTPKGQPNVRIRRKRKKKTGLSKKLKIRLYRKYAKQNCDSIKNPRRKARCQKRKANAIKWLETNNVPYNE